MKKCSACGLEKSKELFYKRSDTSDGLYPACKKCHQKRTNSWRTKNPEISQIIAKRSREKNKTTHKNATKRWRELNISKVRESNNNRYRALQLATPSWLNQEQKSQIYNLYKEASKNNLTIDHIVPLRGDSVSGLHVPWNLRIVSIEENCKKQNKILDLI